MFEPKNTDVACKVGRHDFVLGLKQEQNPFRDHEMRWAWDLGWRLGQELESCGNKLETDETTG